MSVGWKYTDTEVPPRLSSFVGSCAVAGAVQSLLIRYICQTIFTLDIPAFPLEYDLFLEHEMNEKGSSRALRSC